MRRLGRRIISTVSKNNILQSLNYSGGCAPPTSQGRDFLEMFRFWQPGQPSYLVLCLNRVYWKKSSKVDIGSKKELS